MSGLVDSAGELITHTDYVDKYRYAQRAANDDLARQVSFYDYAPDGPILEDFYYSWKPNNLCVGPLGSGKTRCAIHKIFDAICEQPVNKRGIRASRWLTIRNTENDLLGTTLKDWLTEIPTDHGRFLQRSPMTHFLEFDLPDGSTVESEMIFLPLDLEKSEQKLRGYQLTGLWCSETKESRKNIIDMALGRLRRYPAHNDMHPIGNNPDIARCWFGSVMDTNSPDDTHWIRRIIEEPTELELQEWATFRQPGGVMLGPSGLWVPNPNAENLKNLPSDYYSKQIAGREEGFIRVNLANEYGFLTEGVPVHPEYLDHVHSRADFDYDRTLPVYIGVDYGRTPAAAIFQIVNGGYRVFDEFCTEGMSATRFGQELRMYLAHQYGIVGGVRGFDDPAGSNLTESSQNEQSANDLLRAEGFDVYPSPIPNKDLTRRRFALNKPLQQFSGNGWPRVVLHKRAHMLRAGLAGKWCYRELQVSGAAPRFSQLPEKNGWSHVCEALENGLGGFGEGEIETLDVKRARESRHQRQSRPTTQH